MPNDLDFQPFDLTIVPREMRDPTHYVITSTSVTQVRGSERAVRPRRAMRGRVRCSLTTISTLSRTIPTIHATCSPSTPSLTTHPVSPSPSPPSDLRGWRGRRLPASPRVAPGPAGVQDDPEDELLPVFPHHTGVQAVAAAHAHPQAREGAQAAARRGAVASCRVVLFVCKWLLYQKHTSCCKARGGSRCVVLCCLVVVTKKHVACTLAEHLLLIHPTYGPVLRRAAAAAASVHDDHRTHKWARKRDGTWVRQAVKSWQPEDGYVDPNWRPTAKQLGITGLLAGVGEGRRGGGMGDEDARTDSDYW